MGDDGQPGLQALIGLSPQLLDLVIGKFGQDRRAGAGAEGTAFGDLDRIGNRFRQIGEQAGHFLLRFEVMFRRQAAACFLLIDIGPIGNTDQRVMGVIHVGADKMHVIGRHQWQILIIGDVDQARFRLGLMHRQCPVAVAVGVALNLDIQPVGKNCGKPAGQCGGCRNLIIAQQLAKRPIRPARQANHPFGVIGQFL